MSNTFILYTGSKQVVEKQLKCSHKWHGPCMDKINRYYKCKKCHCIEYDCSWKDYLDTIKYLEERNNYVDDHHDSQEN